MRKYFKILSLILIITFATSLTVLASSDSQEDKNTIYISNEEEFLAFAQSCTLDDYSSNLKVYLTSDLNLADYDFFDIPIFLGEFDGGGYTIFGLNENLNKDYQALFRQTEKTAVVKNLNLNYSRNTEDSYVGGIVATNYGTIENCSFVGVLCGIDNVSGICAVNFGYIINCTADGGIFGETKISGIVAENNGSVIECTNYAEINTDVSDVDFAISTSILSKVNINDNSAEILDIGGIVGNNTGIIQSCANYGEVGYSHVGYNVGGIVGMQSGYIDNCQNYGEVYGRKEVGGIVGQFEPYVSTVYSISKLETLQTEINKLSELTSDFSENAQANSSVLSSNISSLSSSVESSKNYANDLLNQTEYFLNENIDALNKVSVTVSQTIANLSEIMDSTDGLGEDIASIKNSAENALISLSNISNLDVEETKTTLATIISSLNQASEDFQKIKDTTLTATSFDEIIENIKNISTYLSSVISNLSTASDNIKDITNILLSLEIDSEELSNLIDELSNMSADTQNIVTALSNTASLINDLFDDISSQGEITFTKTDETYQNTSDLLSGSISDLIDDVEDINLSLNTSIDTALEDFDAINQQLNIVLNLLVDIIQDVSMDSVEEYFVVDDASYQNIEEITAGKISNCVNYGIIDGDINIGGISGSISFEYSFDMEDDYKDVTQTSTNSGFAVIIDCQNFGDITVKTEGGGGIVGLQEFGYITNCLSVSNIESTNASYIGGIVGNSTAIINSCYSKSNLSGTMYIGGIVGSGATVKNCYSVSEVLATKGNIGGIAGDLISSGSLENNFFVSDSLGGLNGISYAGKAEAIMYEELISTENITDIFETVTIAFYVDEELSEKISLDYASDFDENNLPSIAEKEGYYAAWEEFDTNNVTADLRINANYIPLVSTIASEEKENGLSIILAEGTYQDEYVLLETIESDEKNVLYQYEIEIVGDNQNIDTLRYLIQSENSYIEIFSDNIWQKAETTQDGMYLVIDLSQYDSQINFRVIESEFSIILAIICTAFILIILAIFIYKRNNKYKRKHNS